MKAMQMFRASGFKSDYSAIGETKMRNRICSQYGWQWDITNQTWVYSKERDMNKAMGYNVGLK